MPLSTIKSMLVEATGRYDLIDPGTLIGAPFLINAGQKMLDKMLSDGKAHAQYFVDIDIGDVLVPVPKSRTIKAVYLANSDGIVPLTKKSLKWVMENYGENIVTLDQDQPAYWTPCNARPYPGQVDGHDFTYNWLLGSVLEYGHEQFNSIILVPPSDGTYTLNIWGLFFTDTLVNDADESYWTEEHPEILLKASLYQLETIYRNTEGARDWMEAVKVDLDGILKDAVEQEDVDRMAEEAT
jgi:hypothetical protein